MVVTQETPSSKSKYFKQEVDQKIDGDLKSPLCTAVCQGVSNLSWDNIVITAGPNKMFLIRHTFRKLKTKLTSSRTRTLASMFQRDIQKKGPHISKLKAKSDLFV